MSNYFKYIGAPLPDETIAALPAAVTFNAQDLMARGEVTMRGLPYSVSAYNMKVPVDESATWSGTAYLADQFLFNSTGPALVNFTNGQGLLHNTSGMIGYCLSVNGAPASTAEFSLEFVYHLEGVPVGSSSAVATSTPSPAGSTTYVESIMTAMHSAQEYVGVGIQAGRALATAAALMGRYRQGSRNRPLIVD